MNCPSCGFQNALAARFCGGCGKVIESADANSVEAERRSLCVLFCDLVGSTALSQRMDPEDLRELVDAYQRSCGAVVLGHGGFVAQYLGDGIVVYFGYPVAHEDDPSRAVRCALDILTAIQQLACQTKLDLQVRIGIHSGRAVVGSLGGGSGRAERLAVGDTPNIAARVQSEAAPGEILISDSLWRLLPNTFGAQAMGVRRLKGVDREVGLFRVVAEGGQAAGSTAPQTPFVGRGRERWQLKQKWQRVLAGEAQFALLRGEPGIGKSRLLSIVIAELVSAGGDLLSAHCSPFSSDTALHPVLEMMRGRLGFEGVSGPVRVERLEKRVDELGLQAGEAVPLLAAALSEPVDPVAWPAPDLSPVRARQRTLELLIEALHAMAAQRPVLLVIEDLHWADPSTLDLLRLLVSSPSKLKIMVLLTARPEFGATWVSAGPVVEIELEAFDSTEAEQFVRQVAGDKPLPLEVVWQICERSSGNPLYLEEVTRSALESGAFVEHEHSWELIRPLSSEVVPASIEASLMARIDRLGEARSLLQLGATLGREFSHELLMAVAQTAEEITARNLLAVLASGLVYRHVVLASEVVYEHGALLPVYAFRHALICDAAYDSLLRSTRQRYHARVAEVLIERFPEVTQQRPELLAHHLSGAGFYAKAAEHWQIAGERGAARSAVSEAVADFRHALADLEHVPESVERMDRELSILSALAPVLMAVYGWAAPVVGETCTRAIELARRLEAYDRMYPPLWGLWTNHFVGGRLVEAAEVAQQTLAMAQASGVPMLEMTGRHATSYTHYYRGEYEQAIAEAEAGLRHYSFEQELQLAQTFQLSSAMVMHASRASSLWMQGRQDEGCAQMDEMLVLARSLHHPPTLAGALSFYMMFTLYDRAWVRMRETAEEVYALSRAEGFAMWTANSGMHRGRARLALGDEVHGSAEVLEWADLFMQTGAAGVSEGSFTSMVSEVLHLGGQSEQGLLVSAAGEQRAKAGHVRVMEPEIYRVRGNILRDLKRPAEAALAYRRAVDSAREQGALSLELRALTAALEHHVHEGAPAERPALIEELSEALTRMRSDPNRPDLRAARELLLRVRP